MLPRFKIEYDIDLNDVLKTLGMGEAFDPDPNLYRQTNTLYRRIIDADLISNQ